MGTSLVMVTSFGAVFADAEEEQGELVVLSPAVHGDLWPRSALPRRAVH